jgi:light-regulated signal transduction histidine kinase (bacteriophytochrome)
MNDSPDVMGKAGLAFFGKISASISHELKNALSIINESAGLLEDLTLMAQKGAVDPNRLLSTAKRIQLQVVRSDQIIQNMNTFSHSIDRPLLRLDIRDLLACLLAVTRRITDMKGIKISYDPGDAPISITTAPFFLMTLLWHLLEVVIWHAGDCKTVVCAVTKAGKSVEIRFTCPDTLITDKKEGVQDEAQLALLTALKGTLSTSADGLLLSLPEGESC